MKVSCSSVLSPNLLRLMNSLVHLGCSERTPWSRQFTNNRCVFLTALEAGRPKIKGLAHFVSGKHPFPDSLSEGHLLAVSSGSGKRAGALWGLFDKHNNPVHEGSTLPPNHFTKASPPETIPVGLGFQCTDFREHKCSVQSIQNDSFHFIKKSCSLIKI